MSVLANVSHTVITDRNQLVAYFAEAVKPKSEWLIGCEHEKFPYRLSTLKPVSYEEPNGIRDLLTGLQEFGWRPVMEGDHIIGLSRGRAGISLEPGGQFELAGAPFPNLHEIAAEIDQHLVEVCEIGNQLDIGFLGMGFHPTARRDDISLMPKDRYRIQADEMPKRGSKALDMMKRTCTVQVNFDCADEADMVKKYRVSLALQPIATALFASSPFTEGKPNGYASYRMHVWEDVDPARCGQVPFVFEDGFGYERYTDYALDVPMQFIYREGRYINCYGQSFRDFMAGKLPALPGELPTMVDWANHLTTMFPDVRLKRVLEMRGADTGSAEMLLALPSFWTGLLYDSTALDAAWDLVKSWTAEERQQLRIDAARLGLNARMRDFQLSNLAHVVVVMAQHGLRRRAQRLHGGADESRYLDILFNLTESAQSRSDDLLMQYKHVEDFNAQKLFDMCRLLPPPPMQS